MTTLINSIDKTICFNDETIRVVGTYDKPLFVASDICKVLGISNVTDTLKSLPDKWRQLCDLDNSETTSSEKKARKTQTMNCITESGVYRIIMRSNKPIAQKFQEVVCEEILPSIRKTGEFKLQKMLEEKEQEKQILENENRRIKLEKEEIHCLNVKSNEKLLVIEEYNKKNICNILIESYDNKNIVYVGYIGKINGVDSYKFGSTKKISKRVQNHLKTYEKFELLFCIECEKHVDLEQCLKESKEIKKIRFSYPFFVENKKEKTNVTELLRFDDEFQLDDLKKLLIKLKNDVEMSCELRLEIEKTEQRRLDAEIIQYQEQTKQKQMELEEQTKQKQMELEEQTKQKQIELEILRLKLKHPNEVKTIDQTNMNEEINKIEEMYMTQMESEREIIRNIQELNDKIIEEKIENRIIDSFDINIFSNIYYPINVTYKDRNTYLYIAEINDKIYINVNSISEKSYPLDKWKRGAEIKRKILEYNFKLENEKILSIYSHKNKGTWILFDCFCRDYFNWYGSVYNKVNNNTDYLSFGTFLESELKNIIKEYDLSTDKYFLRIKRDTCMFKVRANRDNNFIIITDLFDCNNRDIRSFNKSSERKKYFCENPETHYLSDNKITDEFGMKVTIVHPKLAIVITNWIYKNNDCDEKDQILNFIKYFVDKV